MVPWCWCTHRCGWSRAITTTNDDYEAGPSRSSMAPLTCLISCPRVTYLHLEVRSAHHCVGGEEGLIYRAHVDVPALMLRRLASRQITHGGLAGLYVSGDRSDDE